MSINKTLAIKMLVTASFFAFVAASAQVAIGKSSVTNNSVLLEFGDEATNLRGIILPSVTTAPTDAVNGTFIFNITTKEVEVREGRTSTNDRWTSLSAKLDASQEGGKLNPYVSTGESVNKQGIIIGAETSSKPGVLILESETRTLVLPKVADPNKAVIGPVAGNIVYDTTSDTLAVYDGTNWSYWK